MKYVCLNLETAELEVWEKVGINWCWHLSLICHAENGFSFYWSHSMLPKDGGPKQNNREILSRL